jgi:hypothetical protein
MSLSRREFGFATAAVAAAGSLPASEPSEDREAFCKAFGRRLKGLRQGRGLTPEAAALHSGITAERWAQFEAGADCPLADELAQLGELFGGTLDELLRLQAA